MSLVMLDKEIKEVIFLEVVDALAQDLVRVELLVFLKNFEISLTSFCDFARIGGGRVDTKIGLTISLPFAEILGLLT